MSFRTYREVSGADRSGLGDQVAALRQRVRDRLVGVRHVVAVLSGKGGVGKSWVTARLAQELARRGSRVGVLDADFASPTVARLLGATGAVHDGGDGIVPSRNADGIRVFSADFALAEGQPLRWRGENSEAFTWRGALEAGVLREMLADVQWGRLDYLLIDLPPGTDRLSDLATLTPGLAAIAITIPSDESRRSVARALRAARAAEVRVLGVVENMSGYACGSCKEIGPLFEGNAGEALSREFGLPLLATFPFTPYAVRSTHYASDALARRLMDTLP